MTLYELTDQYAQLLNQYETAETDEEAQAIWEQMDNLCVDITTKADAYARIMQNKLASAEAYRKESIRLKKLAESEQKGADRMKESIRQSMMAVGTNEIATSIGRWKTRMNPLSCDVLDAKIVPDQFRKPIEPPEIPYTIDKAAAKKWFKETGEIIPGLDIKQEIGVSFK